MTGWPGRPATEIAAAVRAGEATAGQVVAAHLDRIARLNAELGAFVRVRAAEAAAEAAAVDPGDPHRVLHGDRHPRQRQLRPGGRA